MVRSWHLAAPLTILAVVGVGAAGEAPAGAAKAGATRPHLEFRIAANVADDAAAVKAARVYFDAARTDPARKVALQRRASDGLPPEPLKAAREGVPGYSWFEIGPAPLRLYRLDDASEKAPGDDTWKAVAAAREKGEPMVLPIGPRTYVIWSRPYSAAKRPGGKAADKRFEYFMLLRDPEPGKAVTGKHFAEVKPGLTDDGEECVVFKLTEQGGKRMYDLTSRNTGNSLAIAVDGVVISAPTLGTAPLQNYGRIVGSFSRADVDELVAKLRADIVPPK
jgi:hypothetical protein